MRLMVYHDETGLPGDFFAAICKAVTKHCPAAVIVPQHPSVKAFCLMDRAGDIRPGTGPLPPGADEWVLRWFASGEVGLSSLELARYLSGATDWPEVEPMDEDDARRCRFLMASCPRERLAELTPLLDALWESEEWGKWKGTIMGASGTKEP